MSLPECRTMTLAFEGEHVLVVTLDRPEVLNAINTRMGREQLELWTRLTADPGALRCVVLTGAGERAFCAGGDLKERDGMSEAEWRAQHEIFERSFVALIELPLPVIAAVNGHAYGGGLETALGCDFIYASRSARFALSELRLGMTWELPDLSQGEAWRVGYAQIGGDHLKFAVVGRQDIQGEGAEIEGEENEKN